MFNILLLSETNLCVKVALYLNGEQLENYHLRTEHQPDLPITDSMETGDNPAEDIAEDIAEAADDIPTVENTQSQAQAVQYSVFPFLSTIDITNHEDFNGELIHNKWFILIM